LESGPDLFVFSVIATRAGIQLYHPSCFPAGSEELNNSLFFLVFSDRFVTILVSRLFLH